jgi:hypothetical protein
MPVAVERDRVTLRDDLGGERRAPLHLLADQEEHGARIRAGEQLEHGRRSLRMGTVVERNRDSGGARRKRARDVERVRRLGCDGGEQVAEHDLRMIACGGAARMYAP